MERHKTRKICRNFVVIAFIRFFIRGRIQNKCKNTIKTKSINRKWAGLAKLFPEKYYLASNLCYSIRLKLPYTENVLLYSASRFMYTYSYNLWRFRSLQAKKDSIIRLSDGIFVWTKQTRWAENRIYRCMENFRYCHMTADNVEKSGSHEQAK